MAFLTGFGKRKEIRYGAVFPDANLTDFPKLFKISGDLDIAAELASGGGIAVTGADGETTVPFGLYPSSDPSSGDLILRAKFSPLTGATTGDVLGYLYYDAAATTTEDKAGVVDNGYALFMPLEDDPSGTAPQMLDWTTEAKRGTTSGSMTIGDLVTGQVGDGLDLDGSDDAVACTVPSNSILANNAFTASIIADFAGSASLYDLMRNLDNSILVFIDQRPGSERVSFAVRTGFGGPAVSGGITLDSLPHRWDFRYAAGDMQILLDGSVLATSSTAFTLPVAVDDWSLAIGFGFTNFPGVMDEFSLSQVARSDDWLAYAYADDFSNADTFSLGPEETEGGGGATTPIAVLMHHYQMMRGALCG